MQCVVGVAKFSHAMIENHHTELAVIYIYIVR